MIVVIGVRISQSHWVRSRPGARWCRKKTSIHPRHNSPEEILIINHNCSQVKNQLNGSLSMSIYSPNGWNKMREIRRNQNISRRTTKEWLCYKVWSSLSFSALCQLRMKKTFLWQWPFLESRVNVSLVLMWSIVFIQERIIRFSPIPLKHHFCVTGVWLDIMQIKR